MAKGDAFPFVKLPGAWKESHVVEVLYEGSRWYVERGPVRDFRHWHRELRDAFKGKLIPFSWVPDFVGVSRSAVHKRAKSGGLTVFSFIVTEASQTFLGGVKERDTRRQYDYVPTAECEAWQDLLVEWADQQARSREEHEK